MEKKNSNIVLQYGDEGKMVLDAQKLLQKAGSKIQLNGVFTIGMRTAVKKFQQKIGVQATGDIDENTWIKLGEYKKIKKK